MGTAARHIPHLASGSDEAAAANEQSDFALRWQRKLPHGVVSERVWELHPRPIVKPRPACPRWPLRDLWGRHVQLLAEQIRDMLPSRRGLDLARVVPSTVRLAGLVAGVLLVAFWAAELRLRSHAASAPSPPVTTSGSVYADGSSSSGGSIYGSDYTQEEEDEWAYQEGDYWQTFSDAYDSGWETGCDIAFEESPDGYLYEDGEQYSADDCYANNPYDASSGSDVPTEIPDDPGGSGGTSSGSATGA